MIRNASFTKSQSGKNEAFPQKDNEQTNTFLPLGVDIHLERLAEEDGQQGDHEDCLHHHEVAARHLVSDFSSHAHTTNSRPARDGGARPLLVFLYRFVSCWSRARVVVVTVGAGGGGGGEDQDVTVGAQSRVSPLVEARASSLRKMATACFSMFELNDL